MSVDKCKIHFNPDNLDIVVDRGTNLLSAALAAGVHISASCDGLGICANCKVKIENGSVKSTRTNKISQEEYDRGLRQACQCQIISDLTVSLPVESRLDRAVRAQERNRASGASASGWKFSPPVKKYMVNLPPASLKDNSADYFRVMYALNRQYNLPDYPADFEVIPKLPSVIRANNWQVTITMMAISDRPPGQDNFTYKLINAEPGDTRGLIYAVALDVGTTSIFAQLLDLNRGLIVAETMVPNKQSQHGPDNLKRIAYSQTTGGLKKLHEEVMASINEALDTLLAASKVERENIVYVSAAANTTMQHLLVGFDPANILKDPYVPVANFVPLVKASQIGMNVPDYVYMFSSPNVSSFVGGDVTAGVVACGIQQRKKLTLYMDIGTSSEIVIGNSEWMVSAACYARPFFEGIGIKNGMVPMPGAIIDVNIDSKYEASVKTIDEAAPQGICGAGLVSVTASLFLAGIIGRNGKFNSEIHSPNIRKTKDGYEYVIVKAGGSATGEDIVITEKDIENIIQTKAAIYAASCSLGRNVNVEVKDFEQIIVAGCLGISLDIEKAITIGLLPDIPRDRFICVGNSALTGARLVTFSTEMLDDSRTVTQMMTDVELNATVNYIDNYKSALSIPNNDARSFPSIIAKIKRAG